MDDERTIQERVMQRLGALQQERSSWMPHYLDCSTYVQPRSGRHFVTDRNRGQMSQYNKIYDNTATRALGVLGAGLMGGATSPARPWFRLSTPDTDLMRSERVKIWLNNVSRKMLYIFQRSNTYRSLHSIYEELGLFGTGVSLFMDDFQDVVRHYPLTAGDYCIATDFRGVTDTMFREFQTTVGAVVGEFGYNNCSQAVKNLYNAKNYDAWVTVVHAIEPRRDRDNAKRDAKNMAYRSVYFEKGGDEGRLLRESGYKSFRALAPRWVVRSGDTYGHSPTMEALGDIKQLQHEQLRKAEAIDYMTKPLLQVPAALKNKEIDRFPGGIIPVDSNGNTNAIRSAFDVNLNLQHLREDVMDVRGRIRSTYYTDLFLMLANDRDRKMTATEVAERHEEKLLMLGPVLERLHNELLEPLIDLTFQRMLEASLVPPPPEELQGQELNVEFVSMLAQAQRAVATNSVDRYVANLGAVAANKPDVLDKFDADYWAEAYADMLGVDPEFIVADDKVALIRQNRAKQQQAAQQAAMAEQVAGAAHKLSNAPMGQNTALDAVINQFSGYAGA